MSGKIIVLLDLDNTILDFDAAERRALGLAFTELGVSYDDAMLRRYHELNILHWQMLEEGRLTREQTLVRRFEALYREYGLDADADETQARYEGHLCQGHWFMPGAEQLLETLQKSCRLFLCSNGNSVVQAGRLESAGIKPYFEGIFISEDLGVNKPSPAYFERCFAAIPDFSRERCILLGDSLTSDIRGGKNAEVKTCWYNYLKKENRSEIRPDYEIEHLAEFPPLLERVFMR